MSKTKTFPLIPEKLIEELERRFPDRIPSSPVDGGDLGVLIGQQHVVRLLRREFEKQINPKEK